MKDLKLTLVYYSMTGINFKLAKWAKEVAEQAGAEVRLRKVQELAPEAVVNSSPAWKAQKEAEKDIPVASSDDLDWADAIIFSAPTRFGTMPSQLKQFIDIQGGLWAQGKLVNKVVSAMTSAQNPHGGQEGTVKEIYTVMMHWGAIIAAPGYTNDIVYSIGGNPYGTSVTQGQDGNIVEDEENVKAAVKHQVNRTLEVAKLVKG